MSSARLGFPPVSYTHLDVYKRQLFVPGLKTENSKPFVIPALQEWKGGDGYWRSLCRLVLDSRYAAAVSYTHLEPGGR